MGCGSSKDVAVDPKPHVIAESAHVVRGASQIANGYNELPLDTRLEDWDDEVRLR